MHGHNKRQKSGVTATTATKRKLHTSKAKRSSLKKKTTVAAPVALAPFTPTPTFTPITTESITITPLSLSPHALQTRTMVTASTTPTLAPALTPLALTRTLSTRNHDTIAVTKRGIATDINWLLESILPAPLLNLRSKRKGKGKGGDEEDESTLDSNSLKSYGQTDKIRKKKSNSGSDSGNGGGSSGSGSGDDSGDDDDDQKKKTKAKKSTTDDHVESNEKKVVGEGDGKPSEGKDGKDTPAKDQKKSKFKDPNVLASVFDISKDEIERLSAPSDAEHVKKKEKKDGNDSSDEKELKPKKKKSRSLSDEPKESESDDKDDKGDEKKGKSSSDKKKKGDKDEDDDDFDEALKKLLKPPKKKGKGDDDEEDDDGDEGPELSEKMTKYLKWYRYFFTATMATNGVVTLLAAFSHAKRLKAASEGSYDGFRKYLSSGLLEKLEIYESDNLATAKFLTQLPPTVPGPNGEEVPNFATIPPGFPTEYSFKVLDFSVLSRQLSTDVAQFGIPDVNLVHQTYWSAGTAIEAAVWMTLFYMLSRKAINHELGWFNNKPAQWAKGLGGMRGLLTKPKVWKVVKNLQTRFSDVAGMDESKQEIVEFVDFLKNPDKYHQVGAKLPKGALLYGPPGTGKTLLAKAVAGEAGVPFISCSGSEFVQTYVGMGAKRVRDLFAQARKNAPCIIFIDEVDAIARKRDSAGNHDEKEATLNQLLVEMDGFAQNEKVIVLAATNRMDMLDKAFIRPGRIDRKILVGTPDLAGRRDVFKVHLAKVIHNYDPDEVAAKLAALTPGMSGADIANVCNEAAIYAARENKSSIELVDFEAAIDRVLAGLKRKGLLKEGAESRKVVAYHEAGHAVAGWFLEHADPLLKATIAPRTNGALGFAQYLPKQSGIRQTEEIHDRMCVTLGGRASEQIFFNKVSTGASDDLRKVTNTAYDMVTLYGMSPKLSNVVFPEASSQRQSPIKPMSDRTSEIIDEEVNAIVEANYARVMKLLEEKKPKLELLAETLLKEETINHETIVRVLGPRPFETDDYLEFIKQSHKKLTSTEKTLLGIVEKPGADAAAAADAADAAAPTTDAAPTEAQIVTETSPTETTPAPTETTTETTPAPTPAPTETTSAPTETTSAPTETTPAPTPTETLTPPVDNKDDKESK